MRDINERNDAAATALSDLFAIDDNNERILVGPDAGEDEFEDAIDVDDAYAGVMDYMAHDILSALTGEKVSPPSDRAGVSVLCDRIAAHVAENVSPSWDRGDGTFLYCTEDAGQIAVDLSNERPAFAGIYFGSALYVGQDHRGKGIGSDLVIEQLLDRGSLAVWSLDTCAFSLNGEKAHLSALRKLREMAREAEISFSI